MENNAQIIGRAATIIAVSNQVGPVAHGLLAHNLAVMRARSGSPVMLLDGTRGTGTCAWSAQRIQSGARPRVKAIKLAPHRPPGAQADADAVFIVTDERDTAQCRAAYGAAHLAIVAIPVDWGLDPQHLALLAILRDAHAAQASFQVIFVVVDAVSAPTDHCIERLQARVARAPGARLARTSFIVPARFDYGDGRCVCDAETCDPEIATALQSLYAEVF